MSFGDWYNRNAAWVAVCILLCLTAAMVSYAAHLKGYQRADKDHQSGYAAHYADQIDEKDCAAKTTAKEAAQCYKESSNAAHENTRAEQDLNAQREMAYWAELMVWFSMIIGVSSIFITGVGIHYVRRTLDVNSAAVKAANDAVEVTRTIGEMQTRAYVGFYSCEATDFNGVFYITVQVKNVGQTTAKIRAYLIQSHFVYLNPEENRGSSSGDGGGAFTLPPNGTIGLRGGSFNSRLTGMMPPFGSLYWLRVKLLYIYVDYTGRETTVSVEAHSRANKNTSEETPCFIFDIMSQSETIHDPQMVGGIELMLQEADQKEEGKTR
jgi:hypothetical protein